MIVENSTQIVFIAGTLLLCIFVFFLIIFVIVQKNKENRLREELIKIEQEVQERAINNISKELHDNIGAKLNAVKRFMKAKQVPGISIEQIAEIEIESFELLDMATKDIRNLSHIFSKDFILNNGLNESLLKEIEYIKKTLPIECTLEIIGDDRLHIPEHELIIFRIIQELITNVIKHAFATELHILVEYHLGHCSIAVSDNGIGFEKAESSPTGIGLTNIENRLKLIKGEMQIESNKTKGTRIYITI